MTSADIIWEHRQIVAIDYEKKTGKPYKDSDTVVDPEYEKWQQSLGIPVGDG